MQNIVNNCWWCLRLLGRLFLFLFVVAIVLAFAAIAIRLLDSLNIVNRASAAFAPYASSLPWLLVLIAVGLFLCIPGAPTALLEILKRVKKVGWLEISPAEDPDKVSDKSCGQVQTEKQGQMPGSEIKRIRSSVLKHLTGLPPKRLAEGMEMLHDLVTRKRSLIAAHAERIGAEVLHRGVRTVSGSIFFDASLARNEDQILVRLLSPSINDIDAAVRQIRSFVDRLPSSITRPVFFDLVFWTTSGETFDPQKLTAARRTLFNVCNVRLFFYSVSENNAVAPMEEIP